MPAALAHGHVVHQDAARGSLLYAREIPVENGRPLGDTVFSSAAAAYDTLAPDMKKKLAAGAPNHAPAPRNTRPQQLADLVKDMPDVEHPVIRTHPVTGRKAIYVREANASDLRHAGRGKPALIKELGSW